MFGLRWSKFSEKPQLTKCRQKTKQPAPADRDEVFATANRRRVQNFTVRIEKTAWTFAGEYFFRLLTWTSLCRKTVVTYGRVWGALSFINCVFFYQKGVYLYRSTRLCLARLYTTLRVLVIQ